MLAFYNYFKFKFTLQVAVKMNALFFYKLYTNLRKHKKVSFAVVLVLVSAIFLLVTGLYCTII